MIKQRNKITGWGNYPVLEGESLDADSEEAVRDFVSKPNRFTPRGNGRSYGDSALGQNLLSSLTLNRILAFDKTTGILHSQSGVLLSAILEVIVPAGFFIPVIPGTKFITIGGAVASDVHGKNHFKHGSFAQHVLEIKLQLATGETVLCSPKTEEQLFWATCGGMGLTGFILEVKLQLIKVETSWLLQQHIPCSGLSGIFEAFKKNNSCDHKVAWLNLSPRVNTGIGVFTYANHCTLQNLPESHKESALKLNQKRPLSLPFFLPRFLMNGFTLRVLNLFQRIGYSVHKKPTIIPFENFFFPLDSILNWNRVYGRSGFMQYQYVLPNAFAEEGTRQILEILSKANDKCMLAVVKEFGPCSEKALLSFPMPGYTLSLDFKMSPTLFALFDKFDEVVLKYGGRLYLAKDARMSKKMMEGYPKLNEFRDIVQKVNPDGKFTSAQVERIAYLK